ncbi:S-formylglutathione hydrolase [Massilia sp. BSC265]|uniref:S-formylglutathione hydrolase n=1 Tax=Massilia sp. BSC265 TaxID=1549812 RepID=UPI0004E914D9|nr:S-formylglutathione hydrolase [Massilia sp. BSC265]KFI08142.1 S-formylglutathione hydrolase [Massilia sp. BSC265]
MLELLSEHACFGGVQRFYRFDSTATGLPMRFSVYLPPGVEGKRLPQDGLPQERLPVLFYLAGLTCTEETFMIKAGAQRVAAREGLVLVTPDTSPRGAGVPGETDSWDFGAGAGFYVDATQAPWSQHYRMYSHILELRELVLAQLPVDPARVGIFGHSMGGHGALMMALRNPLLFRSVSAFAPIAAPMRCPWGRKAFGGYLGLDEDAWRQYDASALMAAMDTAPFPGGILVDQGLADKFLAEQLYPEAFEEACARAGQPLTLRRHAGYDHGYYFISTFVEDHLRFHRRLLG